MEEETRKNNPYDYGPFDKPKGQASVVPDDPLDVFASENEDKQED